MRGLYFGVNGDVYSPNGSFNVFDCWVESISEYGKASIRFEYTGAGRVKTAGLVIDYIDFTPVD